MKGVATLEAIAINRGRRLLNYLTQKERNGMEKKNNAMTARSPRTERYLPCMMDSVYESIKDESSLLRERRVPPATAPSLTHDS